MTKGKVENLIFLFSVWNDIRTADTVDKILAKLPGNNKNSLKSLCGLPVSPYFSALKLRWLLDNVPHVKKAAEGKSLLFGTVDTWIVWVSFKIRQSIQVFQITVFLEYDWWY